MNDLRKTQESFARKAQAQPAHRFRDLYHLVCREDWLTACLHAVLQGWGSRTADGGASRSPLADSEAQARLIQKLQTELKEGTYRPRPIRPAPQDRGRLRPPTVSAVKDSVVQMALKMLLEPIWESDFLNCSKGFRPGRRPIDCICACYARITTQDKYLWVIHGDIDAPIGGVQHAILLKLLRRRIADERVIGLAAELLKAGVMEGRLFGGTAAGIPQGGILSSLFANIYLHEFDRWWWEQYGRLTPYEKARRRKAKEGNCVLLRCGSAFLLLWNGPHAGAVRVREEARQALRDRLHLDLRPEQMRVTHVTDGFDFLGFHLQWVLSRNRKPWLRVTPSGRSVTHLKHTVKQLTGRRTLYQLPLEKIGILSRVLRGWNQYYEHSNATHTASKLTFWANTRLFLWLRKRHKRTVAWVKRTYRRREQVGRHDRWNLGTRNAAGEMVFLYQLTDLHRRPYRARRCPHPYLHETPTLPGSADTPFPIFWNGRTTPQKVGWAEMRLAVLERDQYRCCRCGGGDRLRVVPLPSGRSESGRMSGLQTLCCHCRARAAPCRAGAQSG